MGTSYPKVRFPFISIVSDTSSISLEKRSNSVNFSAGVNMLVLPALPHTAAAGVHGWRKFPRGLQGAELHLAHRLKDKARFVTALRQLVRGQLHIPALLCEQKSDAAEAWVRPFTV